MTPIEQARLDLAHYGFVPDRERALRERWPDIRVVAAEARVRQTPGPLSLEAA